MGGASRELADRGKERIRFTNQYFLSITLVRAAVTSTESVEQIQSTVRLVDLKDLADCFGQSLKRRKTLVKAAAILKGGAVRLRLKQLGSQKLRCQSTINSELPQTRTCPTVDTIKTPIVNVTKVTQAPTTRVWV